MKKRRRNMSKKNLKKCLTSKRMRTIMKKMRTSMTTLLATPTSSKSLTMTTWLLSKKTLQMMVKPQ